MACTTEFIEHICEVLSPLGEVKARKMMGDYIIHLNGKCVITACNNNAYIKKLECIERFMESSETGCPYPGAKEAYILELRNPVVVREVISALW